MELNSNSGVYEESGVSLPDKGSTDIWSRPFWRRMRLLFGGRKAGRTLRRLFLILAGLVLLISGARVIQKMLHHSQNPIEVFRSQSGVACGFDDPTLYPRKEVVDFNPLALSGSEMTARLFGTDVKFERLGTYTSGQYASWFGRVMGWPDGYYSFVQRGQSYLGAFGAAGKSFVMRGCGGKYGVAEVNPAALPEMQGGDFAEYQLVPAAGCGEEGSADSIEIDVMVLYTAKARLASAKQMQVSTEPESREAVEGEIVQALEVTNMALAMSLLPIRFRLCHVDEISETDSAPWETKGRLNETLWRMRSDKSIQRLRDIHRADLVCLFVERGQDAGYGDYYDDYFTETSNAAYSVVRRIYATNHFTMAHELGHNLGLDHHCDESTREGGGHGYPYVNQLGKRVQTIMSTKRGHTRIPFYSDPAMGRGKRPASADSDCYCDGVSSLRKSANVIAHYRCAHLDSSVTTATDSLSNIQ